MSTLWDKGGQGVDQAAQAFLAGEDVVWDRHLFLFDVAASRAHVEGLARVNVLRADEAASLVAELDALARAFTAGTFVLDARHEDGHSAIEAHLTEKLGDTGRKVHTGRSRNDQVLVAQRLFLKDALEKLRACCVAVADVCLERAQRDANTVMPGYTHLQRAVPSTVGLWLAAYAEGFADVAHLAVATRSWVDANPLGTAAGYGINLPLDRDGVTAALGFARVQVNPMYAQNSRGRFELQALGVLLQALLDVRRLAWDLSLYTTAEFGFVSLPQQFTTGSSIMPNKRNPDVVELLRASVSPVHAAMTEVTDTLSLPGGYHRDLQATKPPVLRAFEGGLRALSLLPAVLQAMTLHPDRMAAAISPDMFATDRAVELAVVGVPFRDAYKKVASELASLGNRNAAASVAARTSLGGCANLGLDRIAARLDAARAPSSGR
jgi:argininosuccinate lyase